MNSSEIVILAFETFYPELFVVYDDMDGEVVVKFPNNEFVICFAREYIFTSVPMIKNLSGICGIDRDKVERIIRGHMLEILVRHDRLKGNDVIMHYWNNGTDMVITNIEVKKRFGIFDEY